MSHYWCEHCSEEFKTNSEEDYIGCPNCFKILTAVNSCPELLPNGDD